MGASPSAVLGGPDAGRSLEAAHAALLRDRSLQFDLPHAKPPPEAHLFDWSGVARAIAGFLDVAGPVLKLLFWGGVAFLVLLVVVYLGREAIGRRWPRLRRKRAERPAPADWRPDEARARVLLEDADRLADQGLFAQAAHLLLLRGVQDIQDHRPRAVTPALTSRDIAASPDLPEPARPAFRAIAEIVERSLFGGRPLDRAAWSDCRRAYETLVFAGTWS